MVIVGVAFERRAVRQAAQLRQCVNRAPLAGRVSLAEDKSAGFGVLEVDIYRPPGSVVAGVERIARIFGVPRSLLSRCAQAIHDKNPQLEDDKAEKGPEPNPPGKAGLQTGKLSLAGCIKCKKCQVVK